MRENVIVNAVSKALNIPVADIKSKCRKREYVDSRRIASYLIRTRCGTKKKRPTFQYIAGIFGMDHSSIVNTIDVYEELLLTDKVFRCKVDSVLNLL